MGIYDKGLAGTMFFGLNYQLKLPVAASGASTLLDNIGADGQAGTGRSATSASEATLINGANIAGPGSSANDGDWNGNAGAPLPQLWDDTGHDITSATPAGTTTLDVTISNVTECLSAVANVVSVQ